MTKFNTEIRSNEVMIQQVMEFLQCYVNFISCCGIRRKYFSLFLFTFLTQEFIKKNHKTYFSTIHYVNICPLSYSSSRGRVVKALDLKSNGLCPRRFEPCRLRNGIFFSLLDCLFLCITKCKNIVIFLCFMAKRVLTKITQP